MPAARPDKPSPPLQARNPRTTAPAPRKGGCLLRIFASLLLMTATAGVALGVGWAWLDATLPDVFSMQAYRQIARESSRVYAAGGEVVATFGEEVRTVVPADRIPATVRSALVCAEDAAFYSHPGLDLMGIARALWMDVTTGSYKQGASTLTQQLAKTRFLNREKTITRKLKELVLARKLEERLTKDEILTLYANEVYFGHGRYGIEEAARYFFDKSASELDIAQAALLAGLVNSPGRLSPFRHPDRAKARRSYVLQQMHLRGYITAQDLERAEKTPLPVKGQDPVAGLAPYYLEEVRRFVLGKVEREQLLHGGLRIEIALDLAMQRAAEDAVERGLQRLDRQYKTALPIKHYADEAALREGLAKLAKQQGDKPPAGRVLLGVVKGVDPARQAYVVDLGAVQGWLKLDSLKRYAGTLKPVKVEKGKEAETISTDEPVRFLPGDLIRVSVRESAPDGLVLSPELGPQVALVAVEPATRLVRALVGGDDFALHPFDRALAHRQPGSTFKTFAYGAAIEAGLVGPDTEMVDEARSFRIGGRTWTPKNYSGVYDGKAYTLRDALAHSINSIAVGVADRVGPAKVAQFAERAGVRSPLTVGLPLALGASSVTPLELTNAYATLAAEGRFLEPVLVTRIVDRDGKDLYLAPRSEGTRVLPLEVTRALTDMLGEVVRKGSGKEAAKAGRPVAGKTGTSNGSRDAWFVGFSADLCAGVWVGYDDRKPMPKGSGGTLAVPIWTDFLHKGLDHVPPRPLPRLPHVLAGPLANLPPPPGDPEAGAGDLHDEALEPAGPADDPGALPPLPKAEPED